jgi:hypothetical protein
MPQIESNLELTCWRDELNRAFAVTGEGWDDIEAMTLDDAALDRRFDAGWGTTDGGPFTVWTSRFVYFPWRHDGSQSVAWVSRNPDRSATKPIGGG